MSDGHSGTSNAEANKASQNPYELALSYLIDPSGDYATFVIHATSSVTYSHGLDPRQLLELAGLKLFRGQCPYFGQSCWYREIAQVRRGHASGSEILRHESRTQSVHDGFEAFARELPQLHNLRQQEQQILDRIGASTGSLLIFAAAPVIHLEDSTEPPWVKGVKYSRLLALEEEIDGLEEQAARLRRFLPLIYATGDPPEVAVVDALRYLGLEATQTTPGFTADILAATPDGSMRFGIEVTGIVGSIKKQSSKLTQVLEFERLKEHDEKTILLAGTHRTLPPSERKDLDDFTPEVTGFLSGHPITLMTGLDLYAMIGDVLGGKTTATEVIELIHETQGRLAYP